MKNKNLKKLCESAIFIALSLSLMWVEIPGPAFGGDIDLVMIPLFILSYRNGMQVHHSIDTVIILLKIYPVSDCAEVISQSNIS